MGAVSRIQNLELILQKYVGQHLHIENINETPISKSGENLLKLNVTFKNKKKNLEENLYAVAKLSGDLQKELAFYSVVVPKLRNFQKQCGDKDLINYFPELYGGRLNKNGNKKVDDLAVLLIENVFQAGYEQRDPLEGFNLEESAVILKNLAHFHAVSLAMKLKKPMEYGRHIREFCPISRPRGKLPPPNTLLDILYENNGCLPYISKIKAEMKDPSLTEIREPWGTLCHGSFWTPNIAIRREGKNPVESKIFDFQKYKYDSPLADLLHFLLTSLQLPVLEVFIDSLLQNYHDSFLHHVTRLEIDSKDFGWIEFQDEMKAVSKSGILGKLYYLIYVVYAEEGESPESILSVGTRDVPLQAKQRIWFIVQEWGRRNWL